MGKQGNTILPGQVFGSAMYINIWTLEFVFHSFQQVSLPNVDLEVRTFEVMSRSPDGQTLFMHTGYNPTVPGHTSANSVRALPPWSSFCRRSYLF